MYNQPQKMLTRHFRKNIGIGMTVIRIQASVRHATALPCDDKALVSKLTETIIN